MFAGMALISSSKFFLSWEIVLGLLAINGRHFALQVAPQVEVWGAQVWGVGAPEGVKASANDAVVEVLIYPCQRGI